MSTPRDSFIFQTLTGKTHEYINSLAPGTCTISYRLLNCHSDYCSFDAGKSLIEASTVLPSAVGTHVVTVEAYYSGYPDPTPPTRITRKTFRLIIEPACEVSLYAGLLIPDKRYQIATDPVLNLPFTFPFAPA